MRIRSNIDSLLKTTILLRQNNNKIETHMRGLQALNVPTESYCRLLVLVLMNKITEEIHNPNSVRTTN